MNRTYLIAAGVAVAVLLPSCFGLGWLGGWLVGRPNEEDRKALELIHLFKSAPGTAKQTTPTVSVTAQPDFVVDIPAFRSEWFGNSVAAKSKYGGKILRVSGVVSSVMELRHGRAAVMVDTPKSKSFVPAFSCEFNSPSGLASVKQGQAISILGRFTGASIGAEFSLDGCVIVP